jgi:hypothetical protein
MKKVVKLTESELTRLIGKIVNESKKDDKPTEVNSSIDQMVREINNELRYEVKKDESEKYIVFPKRVQSLSINEYLKLDKIVGNRKIGNHSVIPGHLSIKY